MDVNRHGIQRHRTTRANVPLGCVWPGCESAKGDVLPLCGPLDAYIDGVIAVHGGCVDVFERKRRPKTLSVKRQARVI